MKLKDISVLVGSKFKIRKTRTAVTIVTASVLFGVIITVLFATYSFFGGIMQSARETLDGGPLFVVEYPTASLDNKETRAKAVELYEASTDPDKQYPVITPDPIELSEETTATFPPYLEAGNPFAIAAVAPLKAQQNQNAKNAITDLVTPYRGKVVATTNNSDIVGGTLVIENLTPSTEYVSFSTDGPGNRVIVLDNVDIVAPLIKITEPKDDVVQILMPLNLAAVLLDIRLPTHYDQEFSVLMDSVTTVNQKAIGHQFTGTITNDEGQETKITYEIVGLLPPRDSSINSSSGSNAISTINPYANINIFENSVLSLQSISAGQSSSFIVTNPSSAAFQSHYKKVVMGTSYSGSTIVSFENAQSAAAFDSYRQTVCFYADDEGPESMCRSIEFREFITNQLSIYNEYRFHNLSIVVFAIAFSIIAAIIMLGTVSRVISDEHQTIALYRTVGASTGNILQIYSAYILTLCLLIIACATIIAVILSGVLTFISSPLLTANVGVMHNNPDLSPITFLGFDPRTFLIYAVIIGVGLLCLLLVTAKITSKNILKDLRN